MLRADMRPRTEYQAYLRQIGAVYKQDRSSGSAYVFFLPSQNLWLRVYPVGDGMVSFEYFNGCPCSLG